MNRKQIASILLSSMLSISLACSPFTGMVVMASEEAVEASTETTAEEIEDAREESSSGAATVNVTEDDMQEAALTNSTVEESASEQEDIGTEIVSDQKENTSVENVSEVDDKASENSENEMTDGTIESENTDTITEVNSQETESVDSVDEKSSGYVGEEGDEQQSEIEDSEQGDADTFSDGTSDVSSDEIVSNEEAIEEQTGPAPADAEANNKCGDNLQWTLDSSGTMTISGSGSMFNYEEGASPFVNNTSISRLVIGNGVTSIGSFAFSGVTNLSRIDMPVSVMQVGANAFSDCSSAINIYYAGTKEDWAKISGGDFYKSFASLVRTKNGILANNVKISISECSISGMVAKTFTGKALTQSVTVNNGTSQLSAGKDYSVTYSNNINAGTAKVKITGIGEYTGSVEKTFSISPMKITPTVTMTKTEYSYTGGNIRPAVTVKAGGTLLKNGQDYTVTYASSSKNVGTYKLAVILKGNYSGKAADSYYQIKPKETKIYSVVGSKNSFVAKWNKQSTQVTGYQIQYSRSSKFSSGNKTLTISKNSITKKTIKKPQAGKEYYVRVRTYKVVGGKKYYSKWSKAVTTKVKSLIMGDKTKSIYDQEFEEIDEEYKSSYSIKIKIDRPMIVQLELHIKDIGKYPDGKLRITLKDKNGTTVQKDILNLSDYSEACDTWFYNDSGKPLPSGEYVYTIKNLGMQHYRIKTRVTGYTKKAAVASIKKKVRSISGSWIYIGKLKEGIPLAKISYPSNGIIDGWSVDPDGSVYVWGEKKGQATVTVKLSNGKKYKTKVILSAGNPDFTAHLIEYNTRDNYFTVSVRNNRGSDLTIIRNGAKVEDVDYRRFDRWMKSADSVTIKTNKSKKIRFYVDGDITWYNYKDYTLHAKIVFEGKSYDWHVWYNDSVFKKNGKWYNTYWNEDDE